jgi:hypothetical protein
MTITFSPIMGMQVGFELTESIVNDERIGYCLIDIFILRIQLAWFQK